GLAVIQKPDTVACAPARPRGRIMDAPGRTAIQRFDHPTVLTAVPERVEGGEQMARRIRINRYVINVVCPDLLSNATARRQGVCPADTSVSGLQRPARPVAARRVQRKLIVWVQRQRPDPAAI